jgi:formylglycine-generating enzyme required for sulfatase activity
VPGGTFDRSDYAPATLSDFRLDTYEVSVGRFRRFVAEYSQSMIASGAGKNSSDAADPGWDTTWNASLPVDRAALIAGVKCNAPYQTWTDSSGGNENRPIDCVTWYEALAFCIWDGGRLPTEAEWNYSAAGGSEQRQYPWSNPPSSTTIDCAHANYGGLNPTATTCVLPGTGSANGVGSESPVGDGRWGHADLSGNVWEWTIDWYVVPYPSPCTNCAERSPATFRVNRGGSFLGDAAGLLSSSRNITAPSDRVATGGARCARAP